MNFFLPILFASLAIVTIVLFFIFFPIKITWFYQSNRKTAQHATHKKGAETTPLSYSLNSSTAAYRQSQEDTFDDPEL